MGVERLVAQGECQRRADAYLLRVGRRSLDELVEGKVYVWSTPRALIPRRKLDPEAGNCFIGFGSMEVGRTPTESIEAALTYHI